MSAPRTNPALPAPVTPCSSAAARWRGPHGSARTSGYALFGAAVILFLAGFVLGLTPGVVTAIVACMAVGSVLLAPAIVAGYAVKAADREDRERGLHD